MSKDFLDKILKDDLGNLNVAPKKSFSKMFGAKLFVQNALTFHKAKVAVAALVMGSSAIASFFIFNSDKTEVNTALAQVKQTENFHQNIELVDERILIEENKYNLNANHNEEVENTLSDRTEKNSKPSLVIEKTVAKSEIIKVDKAAEVKRQNSVVKQKVSNSAGKEVIELAESIKLEELREEYFIESESLLSIPISPNTQLFKYKKPMVFLTEVAVDAFVGFSGESEITNSLASAAYQEYYWDFYKNAGKIVSPVNYGMEVNIARGTRNLKFKAATGFNAYEINDAKANYEYDEITEQAMLDWMNQEDASWVNTRGEDTCIACFYAENSEALQEELSKEYNQYSYVGIPIKIGAEYANKFFSIDALAGLQFNVLTNAKGLAFTERNVEEVERIYYWNDLSISALQDKNEMLKRSFVGFTYAANVRLRVTKNFDLLAGINGHQSLNNITEDNHVVAKSMSQQNLKLGITYYPFRLDKNLKF